MIHRVYFPTHKGSLVARQHHHFICIFIVSIVVSIVVSIECPLCVHCVSIVLLLTGEKMRRVLLLMEKTLHHYVPMTSRASCRRPAGFSPRTPRFNIDGDCDEELFEIDLMSYCLAVWPGSHNIKSGGPRGLDIANLLTSVYRCKVSSINRWEKFRILVCHH